MIDNPPKSAVVAVIDIGSSAIRMVIAEVGPKTEIRYLENLQKPIKFGQEVFATGGMTNQSMNQAVQIILNFKQVIDGYGIKHIRAVATSAVREAINRETFTDRVFVRTGIEVELIGGPEENRLELIAVEHALEGKVALDEKDCLIIEIGSGSTEMIVLHHGKVEVTRTLAIGTMRLPENLNPAKNEAEVLQKELKRNVKETIIYLSKEYSFNNLNTFIALGADMRFVSKQLTDIKDETFAIIDKKPFVTFVGKISKMTPDEIVSQFGVPFFQAETLYVSLLFYYLYLNETQADQLIVPMVSIRDGVLVELSQLLSGYKRTDVSKQVINSAKHLGEKFQYDKAHAQCITQLAVRLFDQMGADHGMGARERLLLEVSGILHDIGSYISPSGHQKHSAYLINATDIFGLRKSDKDIVANVVRYHRRTGPKESHEPYMSLPKVERANVSKLAAILRVADALDNSHQQKIKTFEFEKTEKSYNMWVSADVGDISVERANLEEKGQFFTDIFGIPVFLKKRAAS